MANNMGLLLALGAAGAAVAYTQRARAAVPLTPPGLAVPTPTSPPAKPAPRNPPRTPPRRAPPPAPTRKAPTSSRTARELEQARAAARRAAELERTAKVTVPRGCTVANVRKLQQVLRSLGARVAVDGRYGPETRAAWAKVASVRKLDPRFDAVSAQLLAKNGLSGKPGESALVVRLTADELVAQARLHDDARAKASRGEPLAPLQPSREPERQNRTIAPVESAPAEVSDRMTVAEAQRVLNALGAGLEPDGLYGPNTREAWAKAARSRGLPVRFERVDGRTARVEARTRRKLQDDAASGTHAPILPSVAAEGYDPINAKKQAPALASNIRKMGRHYNADEVKLFQRRAGIKPDGLYGPMTREALQHFGVKSPPRALYSGTGHYEPPQP